MLGDPRRVELAVRVRSSVAELLRQHAARRRHHVATGLATQDGHTVIGINIVSNFGPSSVCAEQVALGEAMKRSVLPVKIVVTLRATFDVADPFEVVAPCGRCRELLLEYARRAHIAVPDGDDALEFRLQRIADLLPVPFQRRRLSEVDG